MMSCAANPCFTAFWRTRLLPASVRGPVERLALARFAARFLSLTRLFAMTRLYHREWSFICWSNSTKSCHFVPGNGPSVGADFPGDEITPLSLDGADATPS